jgi:hypothetical protein
MREVQLLSVNGAAAPRQNRDKAGHALEGDPEAQPVHANGHATVASGSSEAPNLERDSGSPVSGLRQEKVPLSDDPFWDQE